MASINAEIKKYELRLEAMCDDKLDGTISPELHEKKYKEFSETKRALEKTRNTFELMAKDDLTTVLHLLKLSKNAPRLFVKGKIDQKRALIKKTHSNLELHGTLLRSELQKPFDTIAECNETGNWLAIMFRVKHLLEISPQTASVLRGSV